MFGQVTVGLLWLGLCATFVASQSCHESREQQLKWYTPGQVCKIPLQPEISAAPHLTIRRSILHLNGADWFDFNNVHDILKVRNGSLQEEWITIAKEAEPTGAGYNEDLRNGYDLLAKAASDNTLNDPYNCCDISSELIVLNTDTDKFTTNAKGANSISLALPVGEPTSRITDETVARLFGYTARVVENLNKGTQCFRNLPTNKFHLRIPKKGSTILGIHNYKAYVLRIDGKHGKVKTPHFNVNPTFTKVRDPHTKISMPLFKATEKVSKWMQKFNKIAVPIAVATDVYRICYSLYSDKGIGKNTAFTSTSVASGWVGGSAGAWAGVKTGTLMGSTIGTFLGPVGTGIGGAIGAISGGIIGGIAGAITLDYYSENALHNYFEESQISLVNHLLTPAVHSENTGHLIPKTSS